VIPLRRIAAFAGVGALATVGYFIIAESLGFLGLKPVLASLVAYGICACWSYLGQKRFAFGSSAPHHVEAPRFVVATVAGLAIAAGMPRLFGGLLVSPHLAVLATCILVPAVSFVISQYFVFRPSGQY
jgi:putative flippase GtrA